MASFPDDSGTGSSESSKLKRHMFLDGINPRKGALLIFTFAEALSEDLDAMQMGTLGSFLSSVGDILSYMGAQIELNEQILPPATDQTTSDQTATDQTSPASQSNQAGQGKSDPIGKAGQTVKTDQAGQSNNGQTGTGSQAGKQNAAAGSTPEGQAGAQTGINKGNS